MRTPGQRLRATREFYGKTQTEFGQVMGVTQSAVANYEKDIRPIEGEKLVKLCEKFPITTDWIFRDARANLPTDLIAYLTATPQRRRLRSVS